jgi:tetratricopeptide (TPR) repeat protein
MKGIIVPIVFLFLVTTPAKADVDSLYNRANIFYQESRYEEAIELYKSIIVAGFESPSLYFNLGNACFKSNKLGEARLYYEKTLKLDPKDEDAQGNILYLEKLLADRFEEVPVIFYKKWIKSLVYSRSSNQWAYFSMLTFLFSILAILTYLFFRQTSMRKTGFYSAIVFLIISLSAMTASWKQNKLLRNPDSAVVIELSVNVRSAPHETGTGLFILHEGAKVWLEDKTTDWQEIRLVDGRKGWLPATSIEKI